MLKYGVLASAARPFAATLNKATSAKLLSAIIPTNFRLIDTSGELRSRISSLSVHKRIEKLCPACDYEGDTLQNASDFRKTCPHKM